MPDVPDVPDVPALLDPEDPEVPPVEDALEDPELPPAAVPPEVPLSAGMTNPTDSTRQKTSSGTRRLVPAIRNHMQGQPTTGIVSTWLPPEEMATECEVRPPR